MNEIQTTKEEVYRLNNTSNYNDKKIILNGFMK